MDELKYCYKYPRPSVTTDCVIFGIGKEEMSVLLVKRGNDPYKGRWAFPGGFLNMDEDAETGARRELKEETGLEADVIEQFGTFSAVNRDPRGRVISIAFYALVPKEEVHGADDAVDARWFSIEDMPDLAFDHAQIFQKAIKALKEKITLYPEQYPQLKEKLL